MKEPKKAIPMKSKNLKFEYQKREIKKTKGININSDKKGVKKK